MPLRALRFQFRRLEAHHDLLWLNDISFVDQDLRDAAADLRAQPNFLDLDDPRQSQRFGFLAEGEGQPEEPQCHEHGG